MRRVLGDTLRRLGADEDGVSDLLLAVTEACTNVLKHGTPGPRYEIVARIGQRGCLIQVLNDERGLEPLLVPAPRRPCGTPCTRQPGSAAAWCARRGGCPARAGGGGPVTGTGR